MKTKILNVFLITAVLFATGCTDGDDSERPENFPGPGGFEPGGEENAPLIVDDGSTTDYTDTHSADAGCVLEEDLYKNFTADGTVFVNFNGTEVSAFVEENESETKTAGTEESSLGKISGKDVTIILSENIEESVDSEGNKTDESSKGVVLQYKGDGKIKYVLSGTYTGTVFIKNKKADAAVVFNNADITSDSGAGPALRFSSSMRTFIVVPKGTLNSVTDTRVLNQEQTMYDTKKGSVYSKGALIFTGESESEEGGTLSVTNSGFKHAVYAKDYVRISGLTLNSTVQGQTGRDCIRSVNAVIVDSGNVNLTGKGTITDDESCGIKVEGEDADEDEKTVEYTAGAGFIIINGGNISINTVAKGITAHWKSAETVINNSAYTVTSNTSLLCGNYLKGTSLTVPNPFVEINGGTIDITTTGTPYENRTTGEKCSPEGIEAKADLTINAGNISLNCTDDAVNAAGSIYINGGTLYAYSSSNDAIDANGKGGITITGGTIVAIGIRTPECAFDCDNNPFKITGGLLVGLGTNNYTAPKNCTQGTVVLSNSYYGSANSTMAITDAQGNAAFAYTLPAGTGSIMVLSSPELKTGTAYTVKTGVTAGEGSKFHNLYTENPSVSGGTVTASFTLSQSSMIYTASSAGTNQGPKEGDRPEGPGSFSGGSGKPGGRTVF